MTTEGTVGQRLTPFPARALPTPDAHRERAVTRVNFHPWASCHVLPLLWQEELRHRKWQVHFDC